MNLIIFFALLEICEKFVMTLTKHIICVFYFSVKEFLEIYIYENNFL